MKTRLIKLCAVALLFGYSPAFAQESGKKSNEPVQQMKMENMPGTSAGKAEKVGTGKKAKTAKATARKVTKKEVGKDAVCPVTGEKFKVTAETGSAYYKGKTYYFCCSACDKPFLENPEKYLSKKQTALHKTYVCPMDDYQSDKPGKCPKCGMTLVEKK